MSSMAMWCHVPSLVSNNFDLANWEGSTCSNKKCWLWGPIWPNTVGPVSWQPGLGWQKFKKHMSNLAMWCHVPSLVRKQIWFGQRGGVNMFKGLVLFWGPVWPNTVGPVSGQLGFGSQKIKMHYVIHGHVMPCAKPCKKQILFGQRGGVERFNGLVLFWGPVWPNTVGLISGQTSTWITKLQLALCQPWPCDAMCQVL